ncbi:ABC-type sugar transporter, periplasmic component [Renibacterium salmoninarum ATCC 33209]|uniref:ABC-type sugar transporter, periplasmic component n=1 Tax=Renibacterium salmoninarum (strain ATCC 33209 / DSM 20767 / JCM 11484 / NBRC 15589 / NCIMB 2235) TaxID=288705 RepID=A9WNW1_RENSM|nr:extracellular solute-binding protein [Renibacterium salmoninarum]ABY22756.1 ABC-type sugar transporter, periplasmic component [Renibacterium salmoninarum ATCC 33209]
MFFAKKRSTAVGTFAVLAASALLVTACGGGSTAASSNTPPTDSKDPVTISFMHAMSTGALKTSLTKITQDFMAKNPNITVDLQEQPDYATLQTKINAQTAAGTPPMIAQVYSNLADEFASSKVIVPLDDYVSQSKDYGNFYDGVKKDLKLTDGKTRMWPFNKSVVVQYYNPTMVPEAPKTWDDFATAAKKASTGNVVALSIDPGNSSGPAGGTALFEIMAQSFGDPVFASDGTPQFTKDGVVKALDYLKQMKKDGSLALGTKYPGQAALGGQTGAFDISSVASYQFNKAAVGDKFAMGVAALPSGPAGTANQLAGTKIALFDKSTDAQKAAAWKFMQFLTSPEEMAYWSSTTGYLPVSKDTLDQPVFKDYVAKNACVVEATKQLDSASSLPAKSWINKASGPLTLAIQDAINNGTDSKQALEKAQDAALKAQKDAS